MARSSAAFAATLGRRRLSGVYRLSPSHIGVGAIAIERRVASVPTASYALNAVCL